MSRTDWRQTLSTIVTSLNESNSRAEYPFARLKSALGPVDTRELRKELERLVSSGRIVPRYRVRSSITGAGIHDYKSIMEIPASVFDDTISKYQEVDPLRDIEVVYTGRKRA